MSRALQLALGASALAAAVTFTTASRADSVTLSNSCSYEYGGVDCSATCSSGSINCAPEEVKTCSKECTETPSETCTTACEKDCMSSTSFSCSDYCSGQCESECSSNDNCGASSSTDCVTACQGQCSFSCSSSTTTDCTSKCKTSCTATENTVCSVKCQVKQSESCSITPTTCTAACSGTGGVIVCNGQVVYVASSAADAASWYASNLDVTFNPSSLDIKGTASCSGDNCTAKASCSASPGSAGTNGGGFLLGGLAFVGAALIRRRRAQ
jgi:MYXO-CTERM domain-containing protein